MAAILAFHHTRPFDAARADMYGNDPFVWSTPFVWSHCHARPRAGDFGFACRAPFVLGQDCVFFLSYDEQADQVVCDCVFVIDAVIDISTWEGEYPPTHPIRSYHFDQLRNPHHCQSGRSWIANTKRSFVIEPPCPLPPEIDGWVRPRGLKVEDYYRLRRRKNARVVTSGAQQLYDHLIAWTRQPGHRRIRKLPLRTLANVPCAYPRQQAMDWTAADLW
jgi:hypothetical protein